MSLATYRQKRRFNRTPEPKGRVIRASAKKQLRFVIQKHDASRLHYDFRLESGGVLKSWAVPKGPSLDPGRKSLAVQVEDHPLEYGGFEGVIPKGEYGGGTVLLWDQGTWEPLHDAEEGLSNGKLHFVLHGEKLRGEWSLVRMHGKAGGDGKNWLLMKLADKYASRQGDILDEAPKSVTTSRSLEQIADERDDVWSKDAKKTADIPGAVKSAWPDSFSPQLAMLAEHRPSGDQWVHEIKFDGYRFLARIKSGKVELITRGGKDWTAKFPNVAKALGGLKIDSAILDGELAVLDEQGRSDFQALQALLKHKEKADPVYFAFDLLFWNGFDLRPTPLVERKAKLQEILSQSNPGPRVRFSEHVAGDGDEVARKACGMGLEGIISKRIDAPYVSRRDPSWLKSKCGQRQEFVIVGYTNPQGKRTGFGSLLLGYHDAKQRLVYAGRVGTGFDEKLLAQTLKRLQALEQKEPPTDVPPPARERRQAHWIKPTLVGEVKFTGWTGDGMLRHPAFVEFRSDKPASQVVREEPMKPEKIGANRSPSIGKKRSEQKTPVSEVLRSLGPNAANTAKPGSSEYLRGRRHLRNVAAKTAPVAPKTQSAEDTVAGVRLTHPDKVFYPDSKTTKRDVVDYYAAVEQWMLPHVVNRPLALLRCPDGIASKCFFQRNWSQTLPAAISKVDVGKGRTRDYHVGVHDLPGIVSLAQIGVLEIHAWNCRADDVERPDQLIFDLDPGPDVTWKQVVQAARIVRESLESLRLPTFLKTSGGKGLHIAVPIEPDLAWDSAKSFCQAIAKSLVEKSNLFVANMRKDLRGGKVYVDFNRNDRTATAVAPYSTRARAGAPVSMPISWEELGKLKSANHFTVETARRYLGKRKADPWLKFEESRVDLRKLVSPKSAA